MKNHLQRLKNVVSGHAAGRGRDEAALRSAAYALCYPANPYDAVFDAHQDLGLEDDCEVVARVAERLERREKRARMTVGRGLVEAPGGALTR